MARTRRTLFLGIVLLLSLLAHSSRHFQGGWILTPDRTVKRRIQAGDSQTYEVPLAAHQWLKIGLHQREIDISMTVAARDGTSRLRMTAPPWGTRVVAIGSRIRATYTLTVVAAVDGPSAGEYELSILESRDMNALDDEWLRAQAVFSQGLEDEASASVSIRRQGVDAFQEAAQRCVEVADKSCEAESLYWLGLLRSKAGQYEPAQSELEQAAKLFGECNNELARLTTEEALGPVYGHMGEERDLLAFHVRALEEWKAANDRRGQSDVVGKIGNFQFVKGDFDAALAAFQQALKLRRALEDKWAEATSLEDIGKVYAAQRDYHRAARSYMQTLSIRRAIGDQRGEASSLFLIGGVLWRGGEAADSLDYFRRAQVLRHQMGDVSAEAAALVDLGNAQRDLGDFASSVASLRQALSLSNQLRDLISTPKWRAGFQAAQNYESNLVLTLIALHRAHPETADASESFFVAERARNHIFENSPRGDLPSLRDLRNALDEDAILLEYWIEPGLSVVWALTREGLSVFELSPAEQIGSVIRQLYDAVTARGQRIPQETPRQRDARLSQADAEFERLAPLVSNMLFAPVRSQLHRKRLFIAGADILQYLPFGILPDPTRSDRAPLMVDHEIVRIPSASALLRSSDRDPRKPSRLLAILADPVFDANDPRVRSQDGSRASAALPKDLAQATRAVGFDSNAPVPRLLFSRREESQLLRMAPPNSALALRDFEATRDIVLSGGLSDYRIWHFASHALLNDDPDLSGLILTLVNRQGHSVDGFLRLRDLYEMEVPADLVVLSACQTGLGHDYRSAGILGLTTGFLRAGAHRVLSTAWSIDDAVTSEFMTAFYQGMLGPRKLAPAQALREAQGTIRQQPQWSAPYYWGGFVLHGNGR